MLKLTRILPFAGLMALTACGGKKAEPLTDQQKTRFNSVLTKTREGMTTTLRDGQRHQGLGHSGAELAPAKLFTVAGDSIAFHMLSRGLTTENDPETGYRTAEDAYMDAICEYDIVGLDRLPGGGRIGNGGSGGLGGFGFNSLTAGSSRPLMSPEQMRMKFRTWGEKCPVHVDASMEARQTGSRSGQILADMDYKVVDQLLASYLDFTAFSFGTTLDIGMSGNNALSIKGPFRGSVETSSEGVIKLSGGLDAKMSDQGSEGEMTLNVEFSDFTAVIEIVGKDNDVKVYLNGEEMKNPNGSAPSESGSVGLPPINVGDEE